MRMIFKEVALKMENNRKRLMGIFILVLVVLAGCGNSSDELRAKSNNQSPIQNTDDDSQNEDLTVIEKDTTENSSEGAEETDDKNGDEIDTENNSGTKTEDASNNVVAKEEEPTTNHTEGSVKERYLKKITNTKKQAEELKATDSSTYAMKKVENDRWDIWDELLNEIYGVLKEQLSPEEMDQLKEEQRNWIKYRDDSALEASLKYKGGTQEHLEYVSVLANLTEERCYELVENFMK